MKRCYASPMLVPRRSGSGTLFVAVLVILITLAGAFGSLKVYQAMDEGGRQDILDRAATIAEAIPRDDLAALQGSEADIGTDAYERLKGLLTRERLVNRDVRFIYLMGKAADGSLFFYADSEEPLSEDYSPPGQVYFEASEGMQEVFGGSSVAEGPDSDRWGVWISAYAPVMGEGGKPVALLGVDLPADAFLADLYVYSALPLIAAAILLAIVLLMLEARRREHARLDEREEFLSIASHEVRSPLSGIAWALALLVKSATIPVEERRRIALMHESALRLLARLNNLLGLSGIEHGSAAKEHFDASDLLRGIGTLLTLPAEARGVALELPTAPIPLRADRQALHHILFNLIGNAVKYTKTGTTVSVTHEERGGMHEFRVIDRGDGIPLAEQKRIFGGYYRAQAAAGTEGTGLGLYVARRAAQAMGGSITLESRMGEGTTFVAKIPA